MEMDNLSPWNLPCIKRLPPGPRGNHLGVHVLCESKLRSETCKPDLAASPSLQGLPQQRLATSHRAFASHALPLMPTLSLSPLTFLISTFRTVIFEYDFFEVGSGDRVDLYPVPGLMMSLG